MHSIRNEPHSAWGRLVHLSIKLTRGGIIRLLIRDRKALATVDLRNCAVIIAHPDFFSTCLGGGTGRRDGFKIRFWQQSESSSLSLGTNLPYQNRITRTSETAH